MDRCKLPVGLFVWGFLDLKQLPGVGTRVGGVLVFTDWICVEFYRWPVADYFKSPYNDGNETF